MGVKGSDSYGRMQTGRRGVKNLDFLVDIINE